MGFMVEELGLTPSGFTRRSLFALLGTAGACRAARVDFGGLVRPFVERNEFFGTVLVAKGERLLFEESYGYANREWDVPNTPDTRYRIGSVSKQFTATCVLLLVQDGKLDLDEHIKAYLPDSPEAWGPITLHHLLTHTSGIPDFLGFSDFQVRKALPSPPVETILRFRDRPLEFVPGTEGRYSNSAYVLLAHIVELVSDMPFAEFLWERVLGPLNLNDTGTDTHRAILHHRAEGYTRFRSGLGNADYIEMSIATGGGSLYSTVADLWAWTLALHHNRVITGALYRRMITPTFHDYGYGVEIRDEPGGRIIGHGGGMEGFSAFLQFRERDQLVVAVLANLNTDVTGRLANLLADEVRRGE